ncbi:MAG: zinc ribbon domain-containing protein [Pyrinomonadaceae bacterium]
MALIKFVRNYQDLSTDKGYQFKFFCDKCGNGYMSQFQTSTIGMAGSLLKVAGDIFGGWARSASNSSYEVQRAVGGKAHDSALQEAVEEGKRHFHQCSRCGKWVCPEVCWNEKANQCEECAPDFQEEVASAQAQAKAQTVREQIHKKAQDVDYAADIDMSADSQVASPNAVKPAEDAPAVNCAACGHNVGAAKFCPECGTPAPKPFPTCSACGHQPDFSTKFCPECGEKMG